ncbi:family 10 glycosylhydrolase [Cohnella xylanilytica]|uniref:Family 10 glycosylhydrolase n=1 Tax=Cohnella xylanilytica TaxID=557555 RepID=A0A841U6K2_9BACL|nr:family 10 glycosylhydrolase [Cohnella xylanilytica]MBB6694678.1 family 10 glycosylhydrolase [Cohnella xylanilytica]
MVRRTWRASSRLALALALAAVIAASSAGIPGQHAAQAADGAFVTEVIVRTVENFKNHSDVVKFMNSAANRHVSVINLNVKEDEDDAVPSGYVFYDSSIAPVAPGYAQFDALADVIAEAHARDIQVRAWIPQFHDRAAFDHDPAWRMMALKDGQIAPFTGSNGNEYFVNPLHPDVQAYERSIIREIVANYDVDGVVLDWLRFDDYNMDLSDYTRQAYSATYGYDPAAIDFATDNAKRRQWNDWRTTRIGEYVRDVANDIDRLVPDLFTGVYILPPEFAEVGQDAGKFKDYVDFVSPMAYFADWGFDPSWVYNGTGILAQTRSKVGDKEIIPGLDVWWTNAQYHQIYSGIRTQQAEVQNLAFFLYGKWTDNDLKKIDNRKNW